jgi:soluble lytic murein transglycosylase-like protein
MPIVELDIGGTPRRFQVGAGYTPEDLDHIVASVNAPIGPSATTSTPTSGPGFAAGQYLTHKGSEFVGALQGVQKDIQNVVTGQPYGTGFPGQRSGWETARDVLQTAAPVAQIMGGPVSAGILGAGYGAGALTRAAGADEPTADIANTVVQLGGGLLQAGGAAAGLKGRIGRQFGNVAETMAQRGTTLAAGSPEGQTLFWALAKAAKRFAPGAQERQAAKGIMQSLAEGTNLTYGDIDDALTAVQGVSHESAIAGILRSARDAMTKGTPEAGTLKNASRWSRLARKQIPAAQLAQKVLGGTGLGAAGIEAYRGHYGRAATLAALGATGAGAAAGSLGHALAAAGPLARAGVGAGGVLSGLANAPAGATEADVSPALPPSEEPAPTGQAPPPRGLTALPGPYGREITAVASLVKIPPQLIQAHMKLESGGNAGAIGDQGRSIGLMQIQPGTAATVAPQAGALLGRAPNLRNPLDNLMVGGLLLRRYLDKTNGDVHAAAQLYNGGEHTSGNAHTRWYGDTIVKNYTGAIRETPLEPLSESGVGG